MKKLYVGVDKVRDAIFTVFAADTDGEAVRNNMLQFIRVYPREDVALFQVGSFEDCQFSGKQSFKLLKTPREIDIDNSYRFPEDLVKNISTSRENDQKAFNALADSRDLTDLEDKSVD